MSLSHDQQLDRETDPAFRNRHVASPLDAMSVATADTQDQVERNPQMDDPAFLSRWREAFPVPNYDHIDEFSGSPDENYDSNGGA